MAQTSGLTRPLSYEEQVRQLQRQVRALQRQARNLQNQAATRNRTVRRDWSMMDEDDVE